jgi:hypothetical protein
MKGQIFVLRHRFLFTLASAALLSAAFAACSASAANGRASPAPSIAVTAEPVPSPTPEPTPTPRPSFTDDDKNIESMIKHGFNTVTQYLGDIDDAPTTSDMLDVFRGMRDFASLEQTRIEIYESSVCTEKAAGLYLEAMIATEAMATKFLNWVEDGMVDDSPAGPLATDAGRKLASALSSLDASSCK